MTAGPDPSDPASLVDRRMALAREWDDLVEQVRRIDGFEDFLRPPPLETLLAAAGRGPVAIVNVSRWRCDALIVTVDGVRPVELPGLSAEEVSRRTADYLHALQDIAPAAGHSYTEAIRRRRDAMIELREVLRSILEWLWDAVADPILTELELLGTPPDDGEWPRLWWCPTGLLTLLPLHGAGYHAAADGRAVLDRVISSYTPTLRALSESVRHRPRPPSDRTDLLFVGVPNAPDQQLQLTEEVARERAFLAEHFPGGLTVIEGADATVATVRDALTEHRWAHISCHGYQNLYDPSTAGFQLTDGTLTITQISSERHAGDFAFLSACKTATGGINLPDEVITLAAALNYTGYRHVVATLWAVHPRVVASVTETVYGHLVDDGAFHPDRAAEAVHQAVRELRANGSPLDDWLPFTHNGP